jgi:DNA-binding transcriptional ArsR family regulator
MDDTQILISLDDDRAKHLGDVISNKSCKKIINFLSRTEGTVTDISQKLKMRLNTVDYNIKKLIKVGLIEKRSFWWSVKGKKMPIYKVSNKKIVVSPRKLTGYTKYVFAFIASGLVALAIRGSSNLGGKGNDVVESVRSGKDLPLGSAGAMMDKSTEIVAGSGDVIFSGYLGMDVWLWFLFGAWFMILLFFVFNIFGERKFSN